MKRVLMLGLVLALLATMVLGTAAFACGAGEPGHGAGGPGYSYGPGDGDCDCPCGDCDGAPDQIRDRVRDPQKP